MIHIQLQALNDWVQKKYDEKYSDKLEPLKKAFFSFYNLIDQISGLYTTILEYLKREKEISQANDEQYNALKVILNRSLFIINRMIEEQPTSIDMFFCDKFIKTFETNLNLLCTYYHSLGHCDVLGGKLKFEKKKIVEGINKLYNFHTKIKQLFKINFCYLKNISHHKKLIASNIKLIETQRRMLTEDLSIFQNFEYQVLNNCEFYDGFAESIEKISNYEDPKRLLMKSYFKILHQFYETQAEIQISLQPLINYCEEIKMKKKSSVYGMIDNCNAFIKITSLLLKPNYLAKNLKKIKMEDFSKLLTIVTQQYFQHNSNTLEKKKNIEEIIQSTVFLIDCVKQLDKVESSGLLAVVNQYKDAVIPNGSKKFINKLMQYKKYMSDYYQCHENIKAFQKALQESIFLEFDEKVNLVVSMEA